MVTYQTWYFSLYNDTAEACASKRWWAAMYGSVVELPPLQGKPNGDEHRRGGRIPSSYPPTVSMLGSLTVVQYFTLLPKFLKHTSAYAVKSSLHKGTKCKK
jgi:hypothetical protein